MASKNETTPLMGGGDGHKRSDSQPSYYFLQRTASLQRTESAMKEGGAVVELPPEGASSAEFNSRPVATTSGRPRRSASKKGLFGGLLGGFGNGGNAFQASGGGGAKRVATSADIMRHRQGAIKVEPKVFFANERTFLAWLHCAVLLAGASIAIMSFAETDLAGQLYGVILLPISIAFMTYAMSQYARRSSMIRRRAPGPYEDITGPTVLGIILMLSILAQFSIKLYDVMR